MHPDRPAAELSQPAVDLRQPAVFSSEYRRLAPTAFAAAQGVLGDRAAAEDVVQDVFCALWRRPTAFDSRRGSLATYVRLMARSRAIDTLRSRSAAQAAVERVAQRLSGAGESVDESPPDVLLRRDGTRAVVVALERLPRPQREAVLLSRVGGLSDRELAQATAVPLGTAKSRIRLGLIAARAQLRPAA